MRSTNVVLKYDSEANAAYLQVGPHRKGIEAKTVLLYPPGLPAAEEFPNDRTVGLRVGFDADGRLQGIEFLMPEQQLPTVVLESLGVPRRDS